MATVKEKPIWKFSVKGQHLSATKSTVEARGKAYVVDEPVQRGGTDLGPMPVEYLFMGLSGCTHVISNKLATANGITFRDMDIDIAVTMDSHGTRLIHPIDIPFPEVVLTITAQYDGPREGALEVVRKLRHHCAVSKMLQESGTRVVENWVLNGEELRAGLMLQKVSHTRSALPRIMVAPNGARRRRSDHPALPVTIPQTVAAAKACFAVGARGLHAHVRAGDQGHSLDTGLYRALLDALAQEVPEMIVQVTSEAGGRYTAPEQRAMVRELRPPLVSVALREMMRGTDAAELREFYHWAPEAGVSIQHILYTLDDIAAMRSAVEAGVIPPEGLELMLVIGAYGSDRESRPEDLDRILAAKSGPLQDAGWMVCAFGRNETACLIEAARRGGKLRIGFENNLMMADGTLAPDNATRVREVVEALTAARLPEFQA